MSKSKKTGKLVETKQGLGYTKNTDELINGKVCVYLSKPGEGSPPRILVDPKNLKVLGYYD